MPKMSDQRLKLINTATQLFQRHGYSATGVSQIIKDSLTPRGSFYHYFPNGKEQLAEEAVKQAGEDLRQMLDAVFTDAKSFEAGVDATIAGISAWFAGSGYTVGCPITAVHLEQTPDNPALSTACKNTFLSWVSTVHKHAVRFGHAAEAEDLAEALILGLEGAWILARARQNTAPFDVTGKMVKSLLV
jgi:TetR/AcrR family transcriptional repressor of lmrAB and yxaGH operons